MSVRFPESLLAVAAVPVFKGYDVRIVDQRLTDNLYADVAHLVGPDTVVFGITAITGQQIKYALEITSHLKQAYPQIPVCWGGVHATLLPEQTAEHPHIDYVIAGDGYYSLCDLFERLRDGGPLDSVPGLVFKDRGGTIRSNAAGRAWNASQQRYERKVGIAQVQRGMDSLPPPPYHLIQVDRYNVFDADDGRRSATLTTSRGCPYQCRFCSNPVLNEGTWRGFSPQEVLSRVDVLYRKYGFRIIYFQDDYFPGSKQRFLEILRGLRRYNREVLWSTLGIRADILASLTNDEWDLLYASGCHSLEIGIESGSPRIIRLLNKGEDLEQMRKANAILARYSINIKYTMIVGFPGETEAEIIDTLRFATELETTNRHAYCIIFTFLPIVGTAFYEEAVRHGFAVPESLQEWAGMEFDGWMKKYRNWTSPQRRRLLEAISFVSYFHNMNVAYKFGGSRLLRGAFALYHPIAHWRFRHRCFSYCVEMDLKDRFFAFRDKLRRARGRT
jgi:radical SAM superfamily enzyme YgiQ (UPF0313 family)